MIIVYGSHDIPVGHVDEAVKAIRLNDGLEAEVTTIQYDREYHILDSKNRDEDTILTTAHYLHHYADTLDHSEVEENWMTGCVSMEHLEKQIECHCGLEDCVVVHIGCYQRTLANGVEVQVYYIS